MAELRIPFDPCNPGQFYACCGLIELFELSGARTLSHFEHNSSRPRVAEFVLTSHEPLDLATVSQALKSASYEVQPRVTANKAPDKDAIAPARVSIFGTEHALDWWLDEFHFKAVSLKCWAGQVTTRKLLETLPTLISHGESLEEDAFTKSRFGVDPRSAWVALHLGYSPNEQDQDARTYPLLELLAAFGLQGFRPAGSRSEGFVYFLWLSPLPRLVGRTACARPWDGLDSVGFQFTLEERGSSKSFSFAEPFTLR